MSAASASGGGTAPPVTAFAILKRQVIERTGHFYYQDKEPLLWERLARRLRATGTPDAEAYLKRLSDPAIGEAEWQALEAEITIGETFFFRYAEQFAALRDTILPAIIQARRGDRRIRIWSAGCGTGAEPYSIAIVLRRLLGEEIAEWRISILGTDINTAFLDAARRAEFGDWALRTLSPEERRADFDPLAGGRRWKLKPQHRALVRFARHNLQSLLRSDPALEMTGFDLILCRNVLIYFHPETVSAIVRALGERLTPQGWMLLGHAEPNPSFSRFLRTVDLPGTIAYRPREAGSNPSDADAPPIIAPEDAAPPPALPAVPPSPPVPSPAPSLAVAPRPPAVPPPDAPPSGAAAGEVLAEVRRLADQGEPERAQALCRRALAADPAQAGLQFYAGLLAWALGDLAEAERALRHAIYLDRSFVMAHYHLGLLLSGAGEPARGRRAIGHALGIARGLPDGQLLREGDGMTAGAFRELARLHLSTLGGEP